MKPVWLPVLLLVAALPLQAEDDAPVRGIPELPPVNLPQTFTPRSTDTGPLNLMEESTPVLPAPQRRMPTQAEIDKYNKDKNWLVNAMEDKNAQTALDQKKLAKEQASQIIEKERLEASKTSPGNDPTSLSLKPSITPFSDDYVSKFGDKERKFNTLPDEKNHDIPSLSKYSTRMQLTPGGLEQDIPATSYAGNSIHTPPALLKIPSENFNLQQTPAGNGQLPYKKLSNNPNDIPKGYSLPSEHLSELLPSNTPMLDRKNNTAKLDSQTAAMLLKKKDAERKQQEEEQAMPRPTIKNLNSRFPDPETAFHRY